MDFRYQHVKQAVLASLRIYGPQKANRLHKEARSLLKRDVPINAIYTALRSLKLDELVDEAGSLWCAKSSRVGLGEVC